MYAELELTSSDHLERVALLTSPMNPKRFDGDKPGFRFRVARKAGYGASPAMARRSLERVDEEGHPRRAARPARALGHRQRPHARARLAR